MPEHGDEPRTTTDPGDDELAARIRGALDGRVAPVTLDEIGAVAARTADVRSASPDRAEAAAVVHEVTPLPAPRRRAPLVLAAVAAIVVLVGAAVLVTHERTDTLQVGDPPAESPVERTGGIFDPAAGLLRDRHVTGAVADASGLLYLGYVDSSTVDPVGTPGGTIVADPGPAAQRLTEIDGLEAEVASLRAAIVADPASPESESRRRRVDELLDRRDEIRVQLFGAPSPGTYTYGLLVVDARTGQVAADHELVGAVAGPSMAAIGTTVWFVTVEGPQPTGNLWRVAGTGAPVVVDDVPAAMVAAGSDAGLWLRSSGLLQHRDPSTGVLVESWEDPTWVGSEGIATGDGGTFATSTTGVVAVDGAAPGAPVATMGADESRMAGIAVAGGSLFLARPGFVNRIDPTYEDPPTSSAVPGTLTGIDARGDRAWFVAEGGDPDPYALVEIVVIDGRTGESRPTQVSMIGRAPQVAVLDDGDAVVCVESIATAGRPAGLGSVCKPVASPFADGAPAVGPVDPVSTPTSTPTSTVGPVPESGTTVPASPVGTTEPGSGDTGSLDPNGISLEGLAPIRLGMTVAELQQATGEFGDDTRADHGPCGADNREARSGGVTVQTGGGTVGTIAISSPAFATADGVRVGMTVAELEVRHPDLDHYGEDGAGGQYAIRSASSAIYFSHTSDRITLILVSTTTQGWLLDLC